MLRGVAGAVGGRIQEVLRPKVKVGGFTFKPAFPLFRRRATGQTITAARRLGKRVVLELERGDCMVLEPRMTGLILPGDPPNRSHLRMVLRLAGAALAEICFWDQRGLGVASLLRAEEFAALLGPEHLGPDALEITLTELRARLSTSRREIKVALLDQRVLAGVGNLYASEILHRARLGPKLPCSAISPAQWRRLHVAMLDILNEAVRLEGSTLADGAYRVSRERTGGYQTCHQVYQRAGQPCRRCGRGEITRIVQAQRSTFFCPVCQRGP